MGFLVVFLVKRNCVGKFVALMFTFFYTIGAGPAWLQFPGAKVLNPFPSQKENLFCHCMKHAVFLTCPSPNTPTHPSSFPKIYYTKCWNEKIHNCRECLTNMATCHWTTTAAPCIFLSAVWHFHTSIIPFCTFLVAAGWLNLITHSFYVP
jgi:hypothetical protein